MLFSPAKYLQNPLFLGILLSAPLLKADDFQDVTKPIFEKYCLQCHGKERQEGGISLHEVLSWDDGFRNHTLMESVIEQIREGDMPPDEADEFPTAKEKKELISTLRTIGKKIKAGDVPENPGRVTLRRLNRTEYNRSVRDLFGINYNPGQNFPADGAGGEGFNNMADALFVQPQLLEKYLEAAKKVISGIYGNRTALNRVIFAKPRAGITPEAAAKNVLTRYASLAYRKRVTDEDLAPLMKVFKRGLETKLRYNDALRIPLTAILVNPNFLFRVQRDTEGKEDWPLSDFELATRLSYFLWSSMPDRELFKLADEKKLRDDGVLEEQVRRMINDERFESFARNFGGQWIGFDKLRNEVEPDKKRFPDFDFSLRVAMYREGTEFFKNLARENLPVTDLIDSSYTFANERLAKHYGLSEKIEGKAMQKVTLNDDRRGGVIGMGGVLTSTSLPLRTSPVHRGAWILATLLGDPSSPPPNDAGELPADDTAANGATFREQLEAHRKNKRCASCHAKIDPLGFGLENFDAIGRWREKDGNGKPIDSTAILAGDVEFSTPQELKALLMAGKDKFSRNMVKKMLSYSLGRSLEYYDELSVNEIMEKLKADDYKMEGLIQSVVKSKPFQRRSAKR